MNFYIVDDDKAVCMVLQNIVEKDMDNQVVGINQDPQAAYNEILSIGKLEIVLVDLLMPKMNGINLVQKVLAERPNMKFIMISQVNDQELREEAYLAGIEFYIEKPVNIIEVQTVISKVKKHLETTEKLRVIQEVLSPNHSTEGLATDKKQNPLQKVPSILSVIGVTSEKHIQDILSILQVMEREQKSYDDLDFQGDLKLDDHQKKILTQRIRRKLKLCLENIASLTQADIENEWVIEYGNILFGYKNIYLEALKLQSPTSKGGTVSLPRFFEGLQILIKQEN
ncbi:response regulator [Facklamia sp. DSM 111018]|uniref:Response regulator n=1 Tax=Facklamia lactis TaxID=2749967 RepID=A0ABS0LUC1_9LACT|nr:response regulator [Facklamia lactis]MBG9986899.1 response regulator [Facklamia lactis]